jgi:hypothetical protein
VAVFGLLVWHALSAVRISPDYLAYFNELVGGPRNGYLYLGDSNLDWGQNRSRAKAYAREHDLPINPEQLPEKGGVVVRSDRIQGRVHGGMYRLLREEYTPVGQLGYNWLIYELERGRRFPQGTIVPVLSGPAWLANPRRDPGGPATIGWSPALVTADPEEEFLPEKEYPGTQAVLMQCPGSASECRFLHSFMLERSAAQAILHFASRDRYEIHVNGERVARRSQCAPEFVEERRPVTRHLQPGLNEVAIWTGACEMTLHGLFVEMRVIQAAP